MIKLDWSTLFVTFDSTLFTFDFINFGQDDSKNLVPPYFIGVRAELLPPGSPAQWTLVSTPPAGGGQSWVNPAIDVPVNPGPSWNQGV